MILHEIRYDRSTDTVQLLYKEFPGSTVYRVFSYDGKVGQRFRDVVKFTEDKMIAHLDGVISEGYESISQK